MKRENWLNIDISTRSASCSTSTSTPTPPQTPAEHGTIVLIMKKFLKGNYNENRTLIVRRKFLPSSRGWDVKSFIDFPFSVGAVEKIYIYNFHPRKEPWWERFITSHAHTQGREAHSMEFLASFSVSQHCFLRPHAHSALKRCGNLLTTTMASLCYGRISWMLMNDNKSTPERKEIHGISIEGKSQSLKSFERSCDRAIE